MIFEVEIRKKVFEYGYILVEAENHQKAMENAQGIVEEDSTCVEWDSITEDTEDDIEARNPRVWENNTFIYERRAIPVLQENGSYILE
jgi:hypothetical protein